MTSVFISLSLLVLVLIYFYRNILVPIIIFIPTLFGVGVAMTFLYFIKDSISAISLSVGAVLLGITIDYSLHILTHYKHNSNIETLYKDIVKPLLMSKEYHRNSFFMFTFCSLRSLKRFRDFSLQFAS
ncbi:hypothetical protein [Flavobacterium piscinae]|uniref:hypothetical protein n=1 Tax=Flavobacterium piscinae TaxID=2506424 RepID=UPI002AAA8547|nr:hypothetical protein [Flavobacterium piscinae]